MNIAVTGGTGFVGSHVTRKLVALGHKVVVLTRPGSSRKRFDDCKNLISFVEDINTLFVNSHIDGVFHFATNYIKMINSTDQVAQLMEANVVGPSVLLDMASRNNVKFFVNTGTCFEYKPQSYPISEIDEIAPINLYASSKVAFESILRQSNLKALTLKLFYPYGADDNPKLIQSIIESLKNSTELQLSNGYQQLDYTYIDDVADAYIKAFEYLQNADSQKYSVFNIGHNETTTVKDIVDVLAKYIGKPSSHIHFSKENPGDGIVYMSCNYNKASTILKWHPRTSITEGLKRCL